MSETSIEGFDPTRALPNVAYREQGHHQLELERIWRRDWVFVATEGAVAEPGDQLPVTIAGQPVLLLRDQQGELVALSNLCAHRGTLLVDQPTNAKRIQCPYHAWTYSDEGRLLSVPHAPKDHVDRDGHGLDRYAVACWHGLVFVSLDPSVEPFAQRVAAIEPYVLSAGIDRLHHWPDREEDQIWAANWKLVLANAMESYHLFQVHPETLEPYTPTKGAYYVAGSARATATGGSQAGRDDDYLLISLPPSFVGVLTEGQLLWQAVRPDSVDRTLLRTGGAFDRPPAGRSAGRWERWSTSAASAALEALAPDFLPEDKAICERAQRGASGDFAPGRLVPLEQVLVDFHHYLDWRLHGARPPAPKAAVDP